MVLGAFTIYIMTVFRHTRLVGSVTLNNDVE